MRNRLSKLRIVVSGLAATYPFGGVFWDYFQYVLGFCLLGHEVLYLEDTGQWVYDPASATFVEDGAANAAYLARQIQSLPQQWQFRWHFRDARGSEFGCSEDEAREFCRSADLFLNISAACLMRDDYFRARVVAFIDSDPMYTQAGVPEFMLGSADQDLIERIQLMQRHKTFFTFGENIYEPDCLVPKELFRWIPTRQPILFDYLYNRRTPVNLRRQVFTTVGSREPSKKPLKVRGREYFGKSVELERFKEVGDFSPLPVELAISGKTGTEGQPGERWREIPAYPVSHDPWVYLDYLSNSFGEWSVAKHAYVASRSGWFSCRTACYLALGVPAVVQDTGFSRRLPSGAGLFAFSTVDEAVSGLKCIVAEPEVHSAAAAELARDYFDYRVILPRLIDNAFSASRGDSV